MQRFVAFLLLMALPVAVVVVGSRDDSAKVLSAARIAKATEMGIPPDTLVKPRGWHRVADFPVRIVQFETVFWEPDDTTSLRELIRETPLVDDKVVLEIGTGSGLVALSCLVHGARRVVATDVNASAIANAVYNAELLEVDDRLDVRLVPLDQTAAYSVIGRDERFDLIISNPPWEDDKPKSIDEYALYDTDFLLLKSLLEGLDRHLKPGGKALLAYGCVEAIRQVQRLAPEHDLAVRVLDDRELDDLEPVFLPGMLLEVRQVRENKAAD